ncbi:MAG: phosphatidylserine decarboxylase [Bdellovibrionaceae bacterium]|nr:phosphatidylserine decarboxylase [Bdellovibrio sp.]
MKTSTRVNQIFANQLWNVLPSVLQKIVSQAISTIYHWKISRYFIDPFCRRYLLTAEHLQKYKPSSHEQNYSSFQDFFTRSLKIPMHIKTDAVVSPCQGYVCENGLIADLSTVLVKGNTYSVQTIFDDRNSKIAPAYNFINIFLHNHNYHRFHSPISGTILNIRHVPGQLNFLRPWLYKISNVSSPSFVNERCIIEIEDQQQRSWFLSFVAGMGVGLIKLTDGLNIGAKLAAGDEIGCFLLGSTCCIAAPIQLKKFSYMQKIELGEDL